MAASDSFEETHFFVLPKGDKRVVYECEDGSLVHCDSASQKELSEVQQNYSKYGYRYRGTALARFVRMSEPDKSKKL